MRTTNRLGEREDRRKGNEDNTKKTSGGSNDIEGEGERAGPVECLQPIRTLATSDIPIYGDLKGKNYCVCHFHDIIHEVATLCLFECFVYFLISNHNVFYF